MCLYHGILFYECGHVRFRLHLFCQNFLHQLNRINDPDQRARRVLPFDPDALKCEPRVRMLDSGVADTWIVKPGEDGTNVVQWVTNLSELCPGCRWMACE